MNNRALSLSLIMAVIAVFFVHSYVTSIEDNARKKFGVDTLVVTAKRDIKEMSTLDETMFELTRVPKKFLEPASISFQKTKDTKSLSKNLKDLSGLVAVVPIKKGEQITYNKITEPNLRTGLAPQVTPGRRAVSLSVTDITGVSKLVKPGDRVDVLASIDIGGKQKNRMIKTILQDVPVLAVGRNVTNNIPRIVELDGSGKKTRVRSLTQFAGFASVTVEVEPVDAQKIGLILTTI